MEHGLGAPGCRSVIEPTCLIGAEAKWPEHKNRGLSDIGGPGLMFIYGLHNSAVVWLCQQPTAAAVSRTAESRDAVTIPSSGLGLCRAGDGGDCCPLQIRAA